jgi:zinc and cadmium transporter
VRTVDSITMEIYSLLLAVGTFFSTLLGGLLAAKYRGRIVLVSAFAAGILISVPLFELLPETFSLALKVGLRLEKVMHVTALGFIFLYVLERYFSVHRICNSGICSNVRHPRGGLFGASELSVHSFMDGFAIGIGFQHDFHVGIIIAFAVICHDFSDGINTVTIMLNSGNSLYSSFKFLLIDAFAPILGVTSTLLFSLSEHYLLLFLPFFAGGFLYLGASDLLPAAHERNPPLTVILLTLLGFLLIFVLSNIIRI